jgi:uncharacterized protein YjeT (DUF2065 family)
MALPRGILRQYGLNLLAIGIFIIALVRYCRLNDAFDFNPHLRMIAFAFGGLVMFIASDAWSDWTGGYGLTRQQWLALPAWFIRIAGGVLLVYFTVALYRI